MNSPRNRAEIEAEIEEASRKGFENLKEVCRKNKICTYRDIRKLQRRHLDRQLNLRDLALLECRLFLGREAFEVLLEKKAFEWLDLFPISFFSVSFPPRTIGRPISPKTLSALVKLSHFIPPDRVIKDEVRDTLRGRKLYKFQVKKAKRQATDAARKRVERVLAGSLFYKG